MQIQQVEQILKSLTEQLQQQPRPQPVASTRKLALPNRMATVPELAQVLNVISKEFNTTLPNLLNKLDRVSGDFEQLTKVFKGDTTVEWTPEEDELLAKNEGLLRRWKGNDSVDRRKKYLSL